MFGCLFDDERPAGVKMTSVHTLPVPVPPNRRLSCGLSGIENQGATCYLNSLLQTLLFTPEFREGLFALSEEELGQLENREKGKVRIIPLQLQRLFVRMLLVDRQAASTTELTDSFGWSNNEELQQHDVQELNRILFSAIESSLIGTSGKDLIKELYHGSTITEIVCQICGKISEREEDFLDLNVIVANFNNLQDSLNAAYLQSEIMKGKNQYRCSTCCDLVDAKKNMKIQCLPPILTLSLLRFSFDVVKGERFKETGKFAFPFEIDMAPYCNKEMKPGDSMYELFSVVIHSGCSSGGHYHAFIRDVDCLGTWLTEEELRKSSFGKENNENNNPLVLIRSILSDTDQHCLPIEFLQGEVTKWIGVGWNKKFKPSHGPLNKFIQKHPELFIFDTVSSSVTLREGAMNIENNPSCSTASTSSGENTLGSPKDAKKLTVMNSFMTNLFDKKRSTRAQTALLPINQNWFDFNDSRVTAIRGKEIEKQFAGKESAYMLFYRRKTLQRPTEAKGNPQYMMPEKLLTLADKENLELENLRKEYETALNTVNLQVHLGNKYKCSKGILEPIPDQVHYIDLAIDKRKTLLDLKVQICELCSELYPGHFILHTARDLPAGLHLFDELSESNDDETLNNLDITDGCKIFMWDGEQINGESFLTGADYAPLLLNISVTHQDGKTEDIQKGFPKTATVSELKSLISSLANLPLDDTNFSKLDHQGEETRSVALNEDQDHCTLLDLNFIDGDYLIAKSKSYDEMPCEFSTPTISLQLQYCSSNQKEEFSSMSTVSKIDIDVDTDITIEKLKAMAVEEFNLDSCQTFVLKRACSAETKRIPMHEHCTVQESGLIDKSIVILEVGNPPLPEEIYLSFSMGVGIGDPLELDLMLPKDTSVQDCLKKMQNLAGLTGNAWHLRKSNWCGEPTDQLPIDGTSLVECGVQHGDTLHIMEGRILPKGYLTFAMFLYPSVERLTKAPLTLNGMHSSIENLFLNLSTSMSDDIKDSIPLGNVELSNESTLEDLKNCVPTLELLSQISLPNIRYLRLQIIDNGRPGRVLRGLSHSLRKLKLQSQPLAVRVLLVEEELVQSEILLNLCRRIPETKSYTPLQEVIWDTSKSASPKALKHAVADWLNLPVDRVVLAKHFPDGCRWTCIDDWVVGQIKALKRRYSGKSSMRNAPYYLKDGDTIGCKDRQNDPEGQDDFMTQADVDGLQLLKKNLENKRLKRQEDKSPRSSEWMLGGNDSNLPRHAKKSEVGITIHVDDFSAAEPMDCDNL